MDEHTARRAAAEFLGGQAVADTLTAVRIDPLGWSVLQTGTRSNRGLVFTDSGRLLAGSDRTAVRRKCRVRKGWLRSGCCGGIHGGYRTDQDVSKVECPGRFTLASDRRNQVRASGGALGAACRVEQRGVPDEDRGHLAKVAVGPPRHRALHRAAQTGRPL